MPDWMTWALVGAAPTAVASAIIVATMRRHRRSRLRRRAERARRGEADADRFLESGGYRIVARQARARYRFDVDGTPQHTQLRVDRILQRKSGGRLRVAEIKTGARAPDPGNVETRRQLLEYAHAFGVDEVFLVDMEAKVIRTVRFRSPHGFRLRSWVTFGLGLGLGLGLAQLSFIDSLVGRMTERVEQTLDP